MHNLAEKFLEMKDVEFVPFLLTEKADIFSIRLNGNEKTETEDFLIEFKDTQSSPLRNDLNSVLTTINSIGKEGALESFFRPEGLFADRICAIPLLLSRRKSSDKCGSLRLYCIRMSDSLLILGGGGEKKTRTYEEDPILSEKVKTLQSIDKALTDMEDNGIDIASTIYL